jgi:hypothetical protein
VKSLSKQIGASQTMSQRSNRRSQKWPQKTPADATSPEVTAAHVARHRRIFKVKKSIEIANA